MPGLSLFEILVIAIIALLVIRPEDLPKVAETLGKGFAYLKSTSQEIRDAFKIEDEKTDAIEEVDFMHEIIDLEGNTQQAYDVSVLDDIPKKP